VSTERFQWARRRGLLKGAIEPCRVAWTPQQDDKVSRHWDGAIARLRKARDASSQAAIGHASGRREWRSSTASGRPCKPAGGAAPPCIEEQYLAQAVDAQDLQVRLLALERARP